MFDFTALAAMTVIVLAQSSPAMVDQPGQSLTAQPTQAVHLGHILGAAMQCPSLDPKRIRIDTIRFNFVLLAGAKTRSDFVVAGQEFSAAVIEGEDFLKAGRVNCKDTISELITLEKQTDVAVKTKTRRPK